MPAGTYSTSPRWSLKANDGKTGPRPLIILDTDIGGDIDDALDIAMLHSLANAGECEILGICSSYSDTGAGDSISVLNNYFGRPALPVGKRSAGAIPGSPYFTQITGAYSKGTAVVQDSNTFYRTLLAAAANGSVTIVAVGPITTLSDLKDTAGDGISALTGLQLLNTKVRELIVTAGQFPGPSLTNNLTAFPAGSANVLNNVTCPITYIDDTVGGDPLNISDPDAMTWTGRFVTLFYPSGGPLRAAWDYYFSVIAPGKLYRPCWGQAGVLYACRGGANGFDNYFVPTAQGTAAVNPGTGSITFTPGLPVALHSYLKMDTRCSRDLLSDVIEPYIYNLLPGGSTFDQEILLYKKIITNAGGSISDATLAALDTYVKSMKAGGVWSSVRLCAPFCGNTPTAMLALLKEPTGHLGLMTNNGVPTGNLVQATGFTSTGVGTLDFGVVTGKGGAYPEQPSLCGTTSAHLSLYCRTNLANQPAADIYYQGSPSSMGLFLSYGGGLFNPIFDCHNATGGQGRLDAGSVYGTNAYYIGSRTSAALSTLYRNGVSIGSIATAGGTVEQGGGTQFKMGTAPRSYCHVTIGFGLTAAQCAVMHAATQALQVALGRNN
jgi:hypothetical protein